MRNYLDLTGKVALITGASSGIGAATAVAFAELGAKLVLGYFHNEEGVTKVAREIAGRGGSAIALRADMREAAETRSLVARAAEVAGPIDILVNNAGSLVKRLPLATVTDDLWREVIDLNLTSAILCTQAVAPAMIERRQGAIVNVGSIAGRTGGGPGAGPYAAAKGGMVSFTKNVSKELAPHGIRVNAVEPGVIATPFHEVFSTPEMMENFARIIPLGRVGKSVEVATAIAFLASDAASFIVGETIQVNGGQYML